MVACSSKPRVRTGSAYKLPAALISELAIAGAVVEEAEKGLHLVHLGGVISEAWELYEEWASSLGKADPLVGALVGPTPEIAASCVCPHLDQYGEIQIEANSIVNQMASTTAGEAVELPGPLLAPMAPANVHYGEVAVNTLVQAISNPGPNYPAIDGMHAGHYICHLHYYWRGAWITVPVFRL